MTQTIDTQN